MRSWNSLSLTQVGCLRPLLLQSFQRSSKKNCMLCVASRYGPSADVRYFEISKSLIAHPCNSIFTYTYQYSKKSTCRLNVPGIQGSVSVQDLFGLARRNPMGKLRNVPRVFLLASYASYKSYCRFDPPTSCWISAGCVLNDFGWAFFRAWKLFPSADQTCQEDSWEWSIMDLTCPGRII